MPTTIAARFESQTGNADTLESQLTCHPLVQDASVTALTTDRVADALLVLSGHWKLNNGALRGFVGGLAGVETVRGIRLDGDLQRLTG